MIKILGCRPKDTSGLPAEVIEKWPEYGEGCQDGKCSRCDQDVVLGPRQALAYDMAPQEYLICCLVCATIIAIMHNESGDIPVRHLGGE